MLRVYWQREPPEQVLRHHGREIHGRQPSAPTPYSLRNSSSVEFPLASFSHRLQELPAQSDVRGRQPRQAQHVEGPSQVKCDLITSNTFCEAPFDGGWRVIATLAGSNEFIVISTTCAGTPSVGACSVG